MNDEKLEGKEIAVKKGKFLKWLDNYWYHYKWPTIIVAFFVVVFSVCLIQSWTNEEKDILITYGGPASLTGDEKLALQTALTDALPEGYGEKGRDGKAGLISYLIYSQEQIKAIEEKSSEDGGGYVDTAFIAKEYDTLNSQYKTGNGSVYLLDEWLYKALFNTDGTTERLKPLSEVFGKTPEGAIGDYGIRLGDTELYKNNPAVRVLPADTVICLHEQIFGQKDYEKEIEAFKAIAKLATVEVSE